MDMNLVEMNTHLEDRPPTVFHGPQEYKDHFVPLIVAELRSDISSSFGATIWSPEEVSHEHANRGGYTFYSQFQTQR